MSILILIVEFAECGSLESQNVLILSTKRLRDLSHLLAHLGLKLSSVSSEANSKFYFSMLGQQLELSVLYQPLEYLREGLKNLAVEGHTPPSLAERATRHLLVAVLEDVELHLDINLIEESPVSNVDPLNDVI